MTLRYRRSTERSEHFPNSQFFHLLREIRTDDAIAVSRDGNERALPARAVYAQEGTAI